ncbi:kinase-like domain-containing protein [Chlamydoabsidia padenii]|nr:kinase-like domain-containing protein [Chlamydoabsidia padenii]
MPRELVENEIYTMTKCNHTNILKLHSVHLHQEYVYLIMPLCAGGSLQQYVFDHHLTFGQLAHIITSIAAGLEEIHRHGYIHRDIKCDNIFLNDQANQVVIGDFGVVSITPAADSSVEEAGVVLFWAPELVQGKMVDKKVDIWALGIVILEIINGGRAPYEDEKLDEEEIKQRIIMNGKPAYPEGLPPLLLELLDLCLDPDPLTRASASTILKHPFLHQFKHEPLFATTSTTTTPSTTDGLSPLESIDIGVVDEDSMLNALKTLQEMVPIDDEMDTILPALSNTPDSFSSTQSHYTTTKSTTSSISTDTPTKESPTPTKQSTLRKCRLPKPSFVLDENHATALPAKDKIANVRIKRQSLTKEYRDQGSRLPMYKVILEEISFKSDLMSTTCGKQLKKAQSVRLSSPPTDITRRPLERSHIIQQTNKRSSPPSFRNSDKKPSLPPTLDKKKGSLVTPTTVPLTYRQKRLPESRTARLTMGVSTTGRKLSNSQSSPQSPPKKRNQDITTQQSLSKLKSTISTRQHPTPSLTTGRQQSSTKIPPPSPTKSRHRLSTSLSKKKPTSSQPVTQSSSSSTENAMGKDDSFKRIKVLRAY